MQFKRSEDSCLCLLSLMTIFLSSVLSQQPEPQPEPHDVKQLEIQVYYETLCYDSMMFIYRQLYPSWNRREQYMNLKLIPYGKAIHNLNTTTGEWIIECQHGSAECKLNKLHACILDSDSLQFDLAFRLIVCGMRGFRATLEECAPRMHIDLEPYKECAMSKKGTELLVHYGDETKKIGLSFVPSIGIDSVYEYDAQPAILRDFDAVFCQKYFNKFQIALDKCVVNSGSK